MAPLVYEERKCTKLIIMHHSLTTDGQAPDVNAIRRYHITPAPNGRGWLDVGYHFLVEKLGSEVNVVMGRPLLAVGAHCKEDSVNLRSLGICVVGNFDSELPCLQIFDKLVPLLAHLLKTFNLPPESVRGHRDFASYKSCPGKLFNLDSLRDMLRSYP